MTQHMSTSTSFKIVCSLLLCFILCCFTQVFITCYILFYSIKKYFGWVWVYT